jgi:GTP cyclohydrolase I
MNSSINASRLIIDNHEKRSVTQEEAELAIKTLIEYIGEDPNREGLIETPRRVIKSFNEFFSGYHEDPKKTFRKNL